MMNRSQSLNLFKPEPYRPSNAHVCEMVKQAEKELEAQLWRKRNSLKCQISNEMLEYRKELNLKEDMEREYEFEMRRKELEKMKINRELDRQKFIESKLMQQHFYNSEEIRAKMSKQLIDMCAKTRVEQIKEKLHQKAVVETADNELYAAGTHQLQAQEEEEAGQVRLAQRRMEANEAWAKYMERKKEQKETKSREDDVERKLLELNMSRNKQHDEKVKRERDEHKKAQKEFLQHQIEQRKKEKEMHRQRELEFGRFAAAMTKQQLAQDAEQQNFAKKMQHAENMQFMNYLKEMDLEKKNTEVVSFNPSELSLITEQVDAEAEAERFVRKKLLIEQQRNEYMRSYDEKHNEKLRNKGMEMRELKAAQKQNDEYNQMMAARKEDIRLKFVQDLNQQVELKTKEMVRQHQQEIRDQIHLSDMNKASDNLTQRILDDDAMGDILPKHPFNCIQAKNSF